MALESSDLIEQLLALEREAIRLGVRAADLERYRLPALEQGLSQLWGLGFGGEPPCTVPHSNWCGNPIPCTLRCVFTVVGSFFTMTSQVVDVEWQGAGNPDVWKGCGLVGSVGSGGCTSHTTPVRVTLTLPSSSTDPVIKFGMKLSGGCPQVGTCADTLADVFQLSIPTGASKTLACSPFDLLVTDGINSAEFTQAP